jgi:hypothetical protein
MSVTIETIVPEAMAQPESDDQHDTQPQVMLTIAREDARHTGPRIRAQAIWGSNDTRDQPKRTEPTRDGNAAAPD